MKQWPPQELLVSYSQLAVYKTNLADPYSDWSDEHVMQGFAWREGSVSFGTMGEADDLCRMEVSLVSEISPSETSLRSIVVPFQVGSSGVTVSSILSEQLVYDVPEGTYELLFEIIPCEENTLLKAVYSLQFVPCDAPQPRVLIHDGEIAPKLPLVMDAVPAI